ncbi:SET domain-containing protein [Solibacillus sp. FSL W8-0474]|uniref:SET domain-containing protein-lysine N-methyltransferase n=1 Tax=Solibacillus merdavium TaxID=2762218 RepID=A0ABR8XPU4_9BACL|nr:SET domain-containing protein [Solibacillus merdavium]MBD8033974.1 SET domain-containing protein-lysine N-methyltransferase [Solibacillus merdavium]
MIEIKNSPISEGEYTRGVFAQEAIPAGTLFHQAPVLSYPNEQHKHIEKTSLADYAFEFGVGRSAILLGYGMLFNHSYEPNATYEINFENETFDFFAYKDIKAGEEIFINYNGDIDDNDPLWFNKEEE